MAGLQKDSDIMRDWKEWHNEVISSFAVYLNDSSDNFILKGGTALYLCYRLDRFSVDIDLDGREKGLPALVEGFCTENGFSYRVAKDTDTVERCMVDYGNAGRPLKIEASYRRREIPVEETKIVNGILVYGIEVLCAMKINAYASRDRIRDLYDLTFIYNNYYDALSPQTIALLRGAVEHKGIAQFDYVVKNQPDELIDSDKLAMDFLTMYDQLGLLLDKSERDLLQN
jgi:predicted nucleotidyltransferase component of viral defense system